MKLSKKTKKIAIKPEIKCNKVSNRFLNFSESVSQGLEREPKISDFDVKKKLGRGSFGEVFLAQHKKTKAIYAIKAINKREKNNENGKLYFKREIDIMYKIRHPNCVRLFGNFEDEDFCYFIMEYAPRGNLYNLIRANKNNGLDKKFVAKIIRELINSIHYLHNMNPPIIHRDIKPENILLMNENTIKLTDFGYANFINDEEELRNTLCGTPLYLAPEMITQSGHGKQVDIWCIGILLFELLTGSPPFLCDNQETLIKYIMKLHILWPKYPKEEIDSDAKDLILKILKIDPNERISLVDMVKHPFFVKNCPEYPSYLEKIPLFNYKPYIISENIPSDDIPIITKKKMINNTPDNKNYNIRTSPSPVNRGIFNRNRKMIFNKTNPNNINNINTEDNINMNNYNNIHKSKDFDNEQKNELIYNKSAINLFPRKMKKNKENKEQIIEEYEKREQKNKNIIEELKLINKTLKEENSTLKNKLNEIQEKLEKKEEELKEKEMKIKMLSTKNNLYIKPISLNLDNDDINYDHNTNNNNYNHNKKNFYTSRTPDPSPKRKRKIPITQKKTPRKKTGINFNNNINSNINSNIFETDNKFKGKYDTNDIYYKSPNLNSIDNQEIDELKKEKEMYENEINILIKEIDQLKFENKSIKDLENQKIINLTRKIIENEKEMKNWRSKVKDLEKTLNNIQNSNYVSFNAQY